MSTSTKVSRTVWACFLIHLIAWQKREAVAKESRSNILFLLADDLGFADVEWRDSRLITPNLRALAFSQHTTQLKNSYVNQLCTPTRSALMTGVYPFRTGTQDGVFLPTEPSGVPLDFTFFPQNLRKAGYKNYMIGKWHLGYCRREYLPTARGFDYFYGYYGSQQGYFNHSMDIMDRHTGRLLRGLDLFQETNGTSTPDFTKNSIYSTQLFADEAIRSIASHRRLSVGPFFLFLAFQSVHAPLQVPRFYEDKCGAIIDHRRRLYCGMLYAMDEAIGRVVSYLRQIGLYENTIIIFSSDNGGDPAFGASNFPLRGQKSTLWEGGTKTTTFIHSPRHISQFSVQSGLFHVVDWHATILNMAGVESFDKYGDGIDQWGMIREGVNRRYTRQMFFYNIQSSSAVRYNNHKLILDIDWHISFDCISRGMVRRLGAVQLFDLASDPYETRNLARSYPALAQKLIDLIFKRRNDVRRSVRQMMDSHRGDPALFNGVFASYWC